MAGTNVKRSQVKTFLNTTPLSTATYVLIGDGVKSGKIAYNPKITDETYISNDSATISVDSYAPKMAVAAKAKVGDAAFTFLDGLRIARAVLASAETDVVNVWLYKTGGPTAYPAEKQTVSIAIDDFGGDGGAPVEISYTINYAGDPAAGTFNSGTSVFTAS
jgi:hypothetical protein